MMKKLFKNILGKYKVWFVNYIYSRIQRKLVLLAELFGNNRIATPHNIIRSIPECCWLDSSVYMANIKSHVINMQVIRSADIESYQYSSESPPAFRTEMHFPRRYVYRLKNVLVNPRTGACCIGNQPLQESYGALRDCLKRQPFPHFHIKTLRLSGLTTCVHATGYYHFLLEEVPRLLWVIDHYADANVYLPDNAPKFCSDILDLLVMHKIIHGYKIIKANKVLEIEDYAFTQADVYSGFVHRSDIQKLRNIIMPLCKRVRESKEKIFISRKDSTRVFDNEDKLEEVLASLNYRTVRLEELTFEKQIQLMQNSHTIITTHGAGLANLIWCHPGTKVIEIFSPHYMNDCFARLSSTLNLRYIPLWASNTKGWGAVNIEQLFSILE